MTCLCRFYVHLQSLFYLPRGLSLGSRPLHIALCAALAVLSRQGLRGHALTTGRTDRQAKSHAVLIEYVAKCKNLIVSDNTLHVQPRNRSFLGQTSKCKQLRADENVFNLEKLCRFWKLHTT